MPRGGRSATHDRTTGSDGSSLTSIYRNPRTQPLAVLVATLILVTFAYQAYVTAQQLAWWAGILVLAAGYFAYRIARVGWRLENNYIEAELAVERSEEPTAEGDSPDDQVSGYSE